MKALFETLKSYTSSKKPRRLMAGMLVLVAFIGVLSTAVFAAWDGYGDDGDTNTGSVPGNCCFLDAQAIRPFALQKG